MVECFKGPEPGETPGSVADAKPTGQASSTPNKESTDKYRNYAVLAGVATIAAATGWYLRSKKKEPEVQD